MASLRKVLGHAVRLALLSSATTTACSSSSGSSAVAVPERDGGGLLDASADAFAPDASADGGDPAFADEATFACEAPLPDVLSGLTPVFAVDYVELRRVKVAIAQDGGAVATGPIETLTASGTKCATASDPSACAMALAAIDPLSPLGWWEVADPVGDRRGRPGYALLATTRADEVRALRSTSELATFLAPIDTAEEARLLLMSIGMELTCTTSPARSGLRRNADGSWEALVAGRGCGGAIPFRIRYRVSVEGDVQLVAQDKAVSDDGLVCGRRPAGLAAPETNEADAVGGYFARCAHLEAASVVSFRRLEAELRALGAPEGLLASARRSRHDEIAHAREMTAAARAHGATVPAVEVEEPGARSAFEIALENAIEGCVLETYGAALAAYQAERAPSELRPLFARIAADELRHAELAHAVAAWLEPRLTPDERARLAKERQAALSRLVAGTDLAPAAALASAVGLPDACAARILAEGVGRVLDQTDA